MNKCPCCGSPVESELVVSLDTNQASIHGQTLKLRPMEAVVLTTLLKRFPETVSMDEMLTKAYGAFGMGAPRTIQTYICWINKKIRPHGYAAMNEYGNGYRLAKFEGASA